MVDDIPMGNAPFIIISFFTDRNHIFLVSSDIQNDRAKLNEPTIELAETKKEQAVNKTESKKSQLTLMVDIRIIILETKVSSNHGYNPNASFSGRIPSPHFYIFHRTTGGIPKTLYILRRQKKNPTVVFPNLG